MKITLEWIGFLAAVRSNGASDQGAVVDGVTFIEAALAISLSLICCLGHPATSKWDFPKLGVPFFGGS